MPKEPCSAILRYDDTDVRCLLYRHATGSHMAYADLRVIDPIHGPMTAEVVLRWEPTVVRNRATTNG